MKLAKTAKIGVEVVVALLLVALLVYAFVPKPFDVETAAVTKGPIVVTVDGDGRTRIKDRFIVSAPVAGQIERNTLRPGDRIQLGAPITVIMPIEPPLLDARSKAQVEAQLTRTRARLESARHRLERLEGRPTTQATQTEHDPSELHQTLNGPATQPATRPAQP